jgi:hypothetical protein
MFREVCSAIEPQSSLATTLKRWPHLVSGLAEPPRRRQLQDFRGKNQQTS